MRRSICVSVIGFSVGTVPVVPDIPDVSDDEGSPDVPETDAAFVCPGVESDVGSPTRDVSVLDSGGCSSGVPPEGTGPVSSETSAKEEPLSGDGENDSVGVV